MATIRLFLLLMQGLLLPLLTQATALVATISVDTPTNVPSQNLKEITTALGLSHNSVTCLLKDRKGYLWVGTQDGLNRYDGYGFKVFHHQADNPKSLSNNFIRALHEDQHGNIWIGTYDGLTKLNPQTNQYTHFQGYDGPTGINALVITAIAEDASGKLWLGTGRAGIRSYDPVNNVFTAYCNNCNTPDDSTSISSNIIHSISIDAIGNVWVGTDNGLNQLPKGGKHFRRYMHQPDRASGLPGKVVSQVYASGDGKVWVGCQPGGLAWLDPKTNEFHPVAFPEGEIKPVSVQSLYPGKTDGLWVATPNKVYQFSFETGKLTAYPADFLQGSNSGQAKIISTLLEDTTGILWIGMLGGGIRQLDLTPPPFNEFVPPPKTFAAEEVKVLLEDSKGTYWLSDGKRGLRRWNPVTRSVRTYWLERVQKDSPRNRVTCLYEDSFRQLWVGTEGGLFRWNAKEDSFRHYAHLPGDSTSLSSDTIYMIRADGLGNLWVGTYQGLNKLNLGTNRFTRYMPFETTQPGISPNRIKALLIDRNNNVWAGTGHGMYVLRPGNTTFTQYLTTPNIPNGLYSNKIRWIYQLKNGEIWLGTEEGLSRLDEQTGKFRSYAEKQGLAGHFICSILEDHRGYLWLSTNKGLSQFNPVTGAFRNYDRGDGIMSDEFLPAAAFQNRKGELFFGGVNGFTFFIPDSIRPNSFRPPVHITSFRLFDKEVAWTIEPVTLKHTENYVLFEFVALNFFNPAKNRYAYKLEGVDKDWVYSGTRRFTSYTNLGPGRYTFHVKAANDDGIWNEQGSSLPFTILPPWWRTHWAYIGYALLLIGILRVAYLSIIRRERLQADLQIRKLEAENLRELDASKTRFFTNISHEFRTPLTLILAIVQDKLQALSDRESLLIKSKELRVLYRNARRLLELINQLLDLSRLEARSFQLQPTAGDVTSFLKSLTSSFTPLAEQKGIIFHTQFPTNLCWVIFDQDALEKITFNLLSNAFKFTPAGGLVQFTLTTRSIASEVTVEMLVKDTGIGIPSDRLAHIFDRFYQVEDASTRCFEGSGIGLALTRELVQLQGGTIAVSSQEREGTVFTVRFSYPVAAATSAQKLPESCAQQGQLLREEDEITSAEQQSYYEEKLLIVEDNADVRDYVKQLLGDRYHILEAADGQAGIAIAGEALPDLIISDVMMPKMDGFTLCKKVKTSELTSHIPVILLTAKADEPAKLEGLLEGADDYLTKPFKGSELTARVQNLLINRRKLRERYQRQVVLQPQNLLLPSMEEKFLKKIMQAIEANIANADFDVAQLSKEVGLSRVQLYRKLYALNGQSPSDLIRTLRLQRAAQLLESKVGGVAEIAYQVGFKDAAHFTKSFTKQFGKTPSAYQQAQENSS